MSEDVFEKPLVMKDFLKGKRKPRTKKAEKPKLYTRVKRVPESKSQKRVSKYMELVSAIAKEKEGTYKVLLSSIKADLTTKSARPSIEKVLVQIAKRDGVDFGIAIRRLVQTRQGPRKIVSYPEYLKWKESNLKLRAVNGELFIEKKTDRPL
jgi:RNase P/RNase MRP subunit p30